MVRSEKDLVGGFVVPGHPMGNGDAETGAVIEQFIEARRLLDPECCIIRLPKNAYEQKVDARLNVNGTAWNYQFTGCWTGNRKLTVPDHELKLRRSIAESLATTTSERCSIYLEWRRLGEQGSLPEHDQFLEEICRLWPSLMRHAQRDDPWFVLFEPFETVEGDPCNQRIGAEEFPVLAKALRVLMLRHPCGDEPRLESNCVSGLVPLCDEGISDALKRKLEKSCDYKRADPDRKWALVIHAIGEHLQHTLPDLKRAARVGREAINAQGGAGCFEEVWLLCRFGTDSPQAHKVWPVDGGGE